MIGFVQACRGNDPADDSTAYYVVISAANLEECQGQCSMNPRRCRGVEFALSTGRCELWTRPAGIESVTSVPGYECYRNMQTPVFSQSISSFQGGHGTACSGDNTSDITEAYYHNISARSVENCQSRCEHDTGCKGINYDSDTDECLMWTRIIGATVPATSSIYLVGIHLRFHATAE